MHPQESHNSLGGERSSFLCKVCFRYILGGVEYCICVIVFEVPLFLPDCVGRNNEHSTTAAVEEKELRIIKKTVHSLFL